MKGVKFQISSMVDEVEDKIKKITMVIEKITKVEEKFTMMIKTMEKAKIKMRKENVIFAKDCCHRCKRYQHHAHDPKDCKQKKRDQDYVKKMRKRPTISRKMRKKMMYFIIACLPKRNINDVSYQDSGYTNHMTRNKKKIVKFDYNFFSSIKFEDDKIKDINGKV